MKVKSIILILSIKTIIYGPFEQKPLYPTKPPSTIISFQEHLINCGEKTICVIYETKTETCTFLYELNKNQAERYFYQFPHCAFIKNLSSSYNILVVSNSEHMPLQKIITKVAERIKKL